MFLSRIVYSIVSPQYSVLREFLIFILFFLSSCVRKHLNKRLRAPTQAFFSHLCSVTRPCFSSEDDDQISAAHVTLEQHGDNLTVKLKSELAGLPFYWEFRCTTTPVGVV